MTKERLLNIDVKVDDELNIVEKPNIHKLDYNESVSLNSEWNKARTIRERIVSDLSSSKKVQQLTKERDELKLENGALLIQLQAEKKKVEELEKEQQIISRLLKGGVFQ